MGDREKIIPWSELYRDVGGHMRRSGGWTGEDGETVIRFGMYNIRNGRNSGVNSALR